MLVAQKPMSHQATLRTGETLRRLGLLLLSCPCLMVVVAFINQMCALGVGTR